MLLFERYRCRLTGPLFYSYSYDIVRYRALRALTFLKRLHLVNRAYALFPPCRRIITNRRPTAFSSNYSIDNLASPLRIASAILNALLSIVYPSCRRMGALRPSILVGTYEYSRFTPILVVLPPWKGSPFRGAPLPVPPLGVFLPLFCCSWSFLCLFVRK